MVAIIEQSRSSASPVRDVFGHPRGLTFLFATEMWERFSYYGMRALLVLYMVKYILLPDHIGDVIGLEALKNWFETHFGPIGIQALSSHIYGFYTGLVYLTPLFGGLLADRVLGRHRTVLLGAALMALGHFMMAFEQLFLFALVMLILGNGAFKPNISAQVGGLYRPRDPRRDRAYSIFYVGINIGAFLAPLICGTLGEQLGWHYGFAAAGIGMTIALLVYVSASPALRAGELHSTTPPEREAPSPDVLHEPEDEITAAYAGSHGTKAAHSRLRIPAATAEVNPRLSILALVALLIPTTLFWATYEQQGNTIALWAEDHTNRSLDLLFWRGEIPVTWFQAFNPLLIFSFTPLVVGLWRRQAKRGREPSTITKMALGCFGVTVANLIMVEAAWVAAGDEASWLWLLGYFVVITIGELYISPIGLSLVSKLAPAHMVSMLMGVWLATSFAGNFLAGWLGSLWSSMDKMTFFLMIAGVAGIAGMLILALERPLRSLIASRMI